MAREWCYKFHNEPWREKKVPRPWTKATEVGSIQLVFIEKSSDCSRNILLSWHGEILGAYGVESVLGPISEEVHIADCQDISWLSIL